MKYVILKVSTTGLNSDTAEIVKIDALKVINDVGQPFSVLINPGVPIPPEASNISGIYDKDVSNAPKFSEIKDKFLGFIEDLPIIGHNINFDLSFINKYLDAPLNNKSMSLMDMARSFNYAGSLKFSAMCKHYNIPIVCSDITGTTNTLFQTMLKDYQNRKDNLDV